MKPFTERVREDQRLVILRLLFDQNSFTSNSTVLMHGMAHLGHEISRDQVKTHLAWLAEQELIGLEEPVPGVYVARLSERGQEVVIGRARVPGVARPGSVT
jgi:Fe2+ or Zn2+ uptake regulation protein